jgi:uncharacterized repeat protein (TIGR01451 family)
MKKTLLYSVIGLALVLGLILPMAGPLMAVESRPAKHREPDEAPYDVGDTIHYVMSVTNNGTAVNNLTRIWDTLPNGSTHWFVEEGVDLPVVLNPGQNVTFNLDYVVDWDDVEWIDVPVGPDYWGVRNVFRAEGTDSTGGLIDDWVEDVAEVTEAPPPVGGEAFPIGKLFVVAPWIALGAVIIAGAAIFVRRRKART